MLKKLAMELKEKENLNDQVEDLKSEIKTVCRSCYFIIFMSSIFSIVDVFM